MSSAQWDFLINAIPDEYGFARLTRVDEVNADRGQYMLVPHFQGDRNVDVEKANEFYTKCLYVHLNTKYAAEMTNYWNMEKKWYYAISKVTGNSVGMDVENFRYFVRNNILDQRAMYNFQLKSVTIPDTIVEIRLEAFMKNKLTTITIPRHVRYIGERAFMSNHLREINFEGILLEKIQDHTFQNNRLRTLVLPEGLREIGSHAFEDNILRSVVFPSTLEYIGDWAFYNNIHLSNVVLPAGCRVDNSAFLSYNSNTNITYRNV